MIRSFDKNKDSAYRLQGPDTDETMRMKLHKTLEMRFFMPYINQVHVYELAQAINRDRTLPPADPTYLKKTREILGFNGNSDAIKHPIQDHRTAESIMKKLNLWLAIQGRPPLLTPRAKCYFTLFYVVYCCVALDPDNHTQWCDGEVNLTTLKEIPYFADAWRVKEIAYQHLLTLGFRMEGKMATNALKILHCHNDILRFLCYNARHKQTLYDEAIKNADKTIQSLINGIAFHCSTGYYMNNIHNLSKIGFKSQVDHACLIAFRYDPLDTSIHEEFFTKYKFPEQLPGYRELCNMQGLIDREIAYSLSMMTPMHKLNKFSEDTLPPKPKKYWTTLTVEYVESIPALEANITLNEQYSHSNYSLGKRLPETIREEKDTSSSKRKTMYVKKNMRHHNQEDNYMEQVFSPSMKKDPNSNKKTTCGMDSDSLSQASYRMMDDELSEIKKFLN